MLDVKCNKCSNKLSFIEVGTASSHPKAASLSNTCHSNQPKFIVSVSLLDQTRLHFNIDVNSSATLSISFVYFQNKCFFKAKSTVRDLFQKVCEYLDPRPTTRSSSISATMEHTSWSWQRKPTGCTGSL